MTRRLVMLIRQEGKPDIPLVDSEYASITIRNDWQEVRSNEALAAMLAGATAQDIHDAGLKGEQVAHLLREQEFTVTVPRATLTEFRNA